MNNTRDFLIESLLRLSRNRNKEDFANYIKGSVFEYVFVSNVEWVDDKKLKVYTDFLPFMDENISEVGVDKYLHFIRENISKIYLVELENTEKIRKLGDILDTLFAVKNQSYVKELTVKEIKNLAEVFKEMISKGFNTDFEVDVVVNKTKIFTPDVIEFLQKN